MERDYIGVDLHKASFHACALTATGDVRWEAQFDRTPGGIAAFAARGLAGARVAVEAMGPTWRFVDALQAHPADVCVVDPRKTKLKAGYAAKTDNLDARRLADALRRESVVSIYIPPPAIRELRELCRSRHHLVRVRAKLSQTIRSLLLRQDAGERALQAIDAEAAAADAAVRRAAAADPIAEALTALVGIGPVLALTLRAEIGTITRFARWPQLACYAGLVTRVESSGGRTRHGRITREGSPWLRWALVEAAIHAMKRPDRTGRWARKLAVRISICPARVALARVLCRDIMRAWRVVES